MGLSSFGVALRDAGGAPFAAISFVSTGGPYPQARRAQIVAALRAQAAALEKSANLGKPISPAALLTEIARLSQAVTGPEVDEAAA